MDKGLIKEQIPCSYRSFTKEEKQNFVKEKKRQTIDGISPSFSSPETNEVIVVNLVPHKRLEVHSPQLAKFMDETTNSLQARIFYIKLVHHSLRLPEAFFTNMSFTAAWLYLQLRKKYEAYGDEEHAEVLQNLQRIATSLKSKALSYLRSLVLNFIEAQSLKDFRSMLRSFDSINPPSLFLQATDVVFEPDLKNYYISGTFAVLKELYDHSTEESPLTRFISLSSMQVLRFLFVPSYSCDVLKEILQTLKSMDTLIEETADKGLIRQYEKIVELLEDDLDPKNIKTNYTPHHVSAYSPSFIFLIFRKFYQLIPSEAFTIDSSSLPTHKVFYSYFYMIGRVFDNLFPESRYFTQFRFIGPSSVYPYRNEDLFAGLSPQLTELANYSTRLLAFFSRRYALFNKYMKIETPFPSSLAANRCKSRKIKVDEVFVTNFKSIVLRQHHYPRAHKQRGTNLTPYESPDTVASFSDDFCTSYPFQFDLERDLILGTCDTPEEAPDLTAVDKSGLLVNDYDPLKGTMQDLGETVYDKTTLRCYFEDRSILIKHFIEN